MVIDSDLYFLHSAFLNKTYFLLHGISKCAQVVLYFFSPGTKNEPQERKC